MSREWSSQSTSSVAHRAPKSLHLLSFRPSLNTQVAPEENSDIGDVGLGGGILRKVPGVGTTPHLSPTHVTGGTPDPYYPPSSCPPGPQSMYTGVQATDATNTTDATTSDSHSGDRHTQYATMRLSVPNGLSASALPSANSLFVGSPVPTATAAEFPPSPAGPRVPSYYYEAYVHPDPDLSPASTPTAGLQPPAHNSSSQRPSWIESAPLSGYSGTGVHSNSHPGPAQAAQPPSGGDVEYLRIRRQQPPLLRLPRSPAYGGSEVQSSPISPASCLLNTMDPFHDISDNEAASIDHQKESESNEGRLSTLLTPTVEPLDGTSPFRQSFQTYATVGSTAHGHDGSSLPPTPGSRDSSMPVPDQGRWAEVIRSINTADNKPQATDSTNSTVDRLSVEALSTLRDNLSSNASQLHFGNSQGRNYGSLVPPLSQGSTSDGLLTSTSANSGSDSFTAFELMSFPKPPTTVPRQQGSATPPTRSPWVKGLTLPMPTNMAIPRRSIREPGTPTAHPLPSTPGPPTPVPPTSHSTPSTPRSVPVPRPTFHVVKTPSRVVVTALDAPVPTVVVPEGESWWDDSSSSTRAPSPLLQSKSRLATPSARSSGDGSTATKSVTPSYVRRISALIHATEQPTWASRDSVYETEPQVRVSEDTDQLGALDRQSEEEPVAVIRVVRTASLSLRSKALLTRAPSTGALATPPVVQVQHTAPLETHSPTEDTIAPLRLKTEDSVLRQSVHAYLSRDASPSSATTAASPTPTMLKLSPSLRRQPPVREPGFFPENIDEIDERSVSTYDVDRTGWRIASLDIRGVDTRIDRGSEGELPLYNEKDLPRVPYLESREGFSNNHPLPPIPPSPPPHLPTVPPPAILSDTDVQRQPDQNPDRPRRQESFGSDTLTRVSSLLSRLSKSTMPSTPTIVSRPCTRKSKRGTIIPPPLPPPPLPLPLTPSQMQFQRSRRPHPCEGMADHELMEWAGSHERVAQGGGVPWQSWDVRQNQMPLPAPIPSLDDVYLHHQQRPQQQAQGSSGRGYMHKNALSKASSIRSMFSNRSDRSRHRVSRNATLGASGINTSTIGEVNGRFTELDDEEKRKPTVQMRALGVDPRPPQKGELELDPDVDSGSAGGPLPNRKQWSRRSKWVAVGLFLLALIGLVVGLVVILTRSTSDARASSCTASNATGRLCDIDKTCVCTSNVSGRCNPVARTIVDLIPQMNTLFSVNFTASNVSLTLWDLLGDPLNDCSAQALLIDVAPGLAVSSSPNRTEFARAALLYSLMQTESLNITAQIRSSIANADFSNLAGQDGPTQDDGDTVGLTFGVDGFLYNFGSMTLRPPSISWKDNARATGDQISRVLSIVDSVLDRMYSFSTASSTQRSTALQKYWTSVLQLPSEQLDTFLNALRDAPIVLPFDATSDSVSSLMSSSNTTSFPPPAACYPGLSEVNRADIDTVETTAFGLPSNSPVTSANFDVGCFARRPTYGILNVLNLRQPFAGGRRGLTIQASQLTTAAGPRAVLKVGEQLVGLARASAPSARPNTPIPASNADPRQYGTLLHLNHVALAYLQSFPTTTLATTAAQFIMSTSQLPPNSNSSLFLDTNSLLDIPIIEVSVFGELLPADMDQFYSDFAGPQGQLFFGTQRGDVFRKWALHDSNDTILWSAAAIARTVVREAKEPYSPFEAVWEATLKGDHITPDSVVGALIGAGLFGS